MTTAENLSADLVIVGAGAAGLTAAVSAAEAGLKNIIVLEARSGVGGNGNFVLGCFAAESKVQRFFGIECRKDDVFKMLMRYHHWKTNPRLVRNLVNKSGETIEWLEKHGVVWGTPLSHFPGQTPRAHHHALGAATTGTAIMNAMNKSAQSLGVKILTKTKGSSLIMEKGKVTGVKATSGDKELTIQTKAVIVATGGLFGADKMVQEGINWPQTYEPNNFVSWGLKYNGDGVRMLTEAGALREGRIMLETHAPVYAGELKITTYVPPIAHLTMWVNKEGRRFADETCGDRFSEGANAVMRQTDGIMYSIFDEEIKEELLQRGYSEFELACGALLSGGAPKDPNDIAANRKSLDDDIAIEEKKGFAKKANTLQEIAKYIGSEPAVLEATIEEYNSFCDKGHDDDFAKDPQVLRPLRKAPFYALKCAACINTIHGDIKCNENMNVLTTGDQPIAGLYAAGVDTGGADWTTYDTELTGHSFGFSINGGRIAAEDAARYILGADNRPKAHAGTASK
jgi:fumarate reductase flavoprotein subunit